MLIEAFIYYFWLPNGAWEPPYTAKIKARKISGVFIFLIKFKEVNMRKGKLFSLL